MKQVYNVGDWYQDKDGNEMECVLIQNVKRDDYLKRTVDAQAVYIRDEYYRAGKSFDCYKDSDTNTLISLKRNTKVFIGFTY